MQLILGVTGGLGSAIARELVQNKHTVRWFCRNTERAKGLAEQLGIRKEVELVQGSIWVLSELLSAAKDCEAIFCGVRLPYAQWPEELPAFFHNLQEISGLSGAALVLPLEREGHPSLSGLQAELLQRMAYNCEQRAVRALGLKIGDWLDKEHSSPLMKKALQESTTGTFGWPFTSPRLIHSLSDIARLAVQLEALKRPGFELWELPGFLIDGPQFSELLSKSLDRPVKLQPRSRLSLRAAGLISAAAFEYAQGSLFGEQAAYRPDPKLKDVKLLPQLTPLEQLIKDAR